MLNKTCSCTVEDCIPALCQSEEDLQWGGGEGRAGAALWQLWPPSSEWHCVAVSTSSAASLSSLPDRLQKGETAAFPQEAASPHPWSQLHPCLLCQEQPLIYLIDSKRYQGSHSLQLGHSDICKYVFKFGKYVQYLEYAENDTSVEWGTSFQRACATPGKLSSFPHQSWELESAGEEGSPLWAGVSKPCRAWQHSACS